MKLAATVISTLMLASSVESDSAIPETRRADVVDEMHGVAVPDPYRWLEDMDSPEVQSWAAAQNAATEAFVASDLEETRQRLISYSDFLIKRAYQKYGPNTFYRLSWAGSVTSGLYVESGGEARRLAGLDVSQRTSVSAMNIRGYWPSPDGALVLVMQSPPDQRWGTLDLIETATGRVRHSSRDAYGGLTSAAWLPDGSGYAYSAYERDDDAPVRGRIVRRTVDSGSERVLLDADQTGDARRVLVPRSAIDSDRLFVEARSGSSGKNAVYVIESSDQEPVKLFDSTASWLFLGAKADCAWFYTNEHSPKGRVIRVSDIDEKRVIETIVPEGAGSISASSQVGGNAFGLFGDRIALLYLEDATPILRVFDLQGLQTAQMEIPPSGSVWGGFIGDPSKAELYYQFLGIAEPSSIYRVDLLNGRRERVEAPDNLIQPDDVVARRVFVDRGNGVKVPVLIARRRGASPSQPRPTILYGYGAFGWVSFLFYQPDFVDWLLRENGVMVVAGVRGGGEYGSAWHEAGRGVNRQNAIDDYIAVAKYLVQEGITSPDLLVANGGSASGGLVAAAVNQHPELFGAVTLDYPALDLIRYPKFGIARYWSEEFGSPDDPEEFQTLLATSPYHNVREGACYPATLVRTGEHDPTVTPVHGFKFAARLQHASACGNPIMLDVMEGAGHDFGSTPEEIAKSHAVSLEFLRRVLPAKTNLSDVK